MNRRPTIAARAFVLGSILAAILAFAVVATEPNVAIVPVHDGFCVCDGLDPHCTLPVSQGELIDL